MASRKKSNSAASKSSAKPLGPQATPIAGPRTPKIKPSDPLPTRGNYILRGKLYRVCNSPFHEGERHQPAKAFYASTKLATLNQPEDVCRLCIKARAAEYAARRKAAKQPAKATKKPKAPKAELIPYKPAHGRSRNVAVVRKGRTFVVLNVPGEGERRFAWTPGTMVRERVA